MTFMKKQDSEPESPPVEVEPGGVQGHSLLGGDHHLGVPLAAVHRAQQAQHHRVSLLIAEGHWGVIRILQGRGQQNLTSCGPLKWPGAP